MIFFCYTCISVFILEEIITLVFSNSFALSKFLFPLVVYLYLRKLKKSEKYKAIFISLLLSLLYHSTHTFISVTLSSITGDEVVLHYKSTISFRSIVDDLFFYSNNNSLFSSGY